MSFNGIFCAVCRAPMDPPIYISERELSVTSLCETLQERTAVFFCGTCAHLQTPPITNITEYYASTYKILIDTEEEDQIYQDRDGNSTYRVDHQVATFLQKVALKPGAAILDYGCAKSATLRKLCLQRPDVQPYMFDVSPMYIPFWERFAPPTNWAVYHAPSSWVGRFDIVTSFFSLEHVAEPLQMSTEVHRLLRTGGTFYGVVPNVYDNLSDFIVRDHANHFSAVSLARLLKSSGFEAVEVDSDSHFGALIVTATKAERLPPLGVTAAGEITAHKQRAGQCSEFWTRLGARARRFEREHTNERAAIYGSGVYGTYIATNLMDLSNVTCFIDRNPHRQGKELLGLPILAADSLGEDVTSIYVGLNPMTAQHSIGSVPEWRHRQNTYFFI